MDEIPEEITVIVDRYADGYPPTDLPVLVKFVSEILTAYDRLIQEGLVH